MYVEEATTLHEWQTHDLRDAAERKHYFSLVLLRSRVTNRNPVGCVTVVGLGPGHLALLTERLERSDDPATANGQGARQISLR